MLRYDRVREQEALTEAMVNEGRHSDWAVNGLRSILEDVSLQHLHRRNAWKAIVSRRPRKVRLVR